MLGLVISIHDFLLEMFHAISKERDRHAKQALILNGSGGKVHIANTLFYPRQEDAHVQLAYNKLPQWVVDVLAHGTRNILAFLGSFRWASAPVGKAGCSWLELLVTFFVCGGSLEDFDVNEKAQGTKHSLRLVLLAFKRTVRAVVAIYLAPYSQIYFKASKCPQSRGREIGFTNHCACITGLPSSTNKQGAYVTEQLVGLRHTFTRNSRKLLVNGLLQLQPRKFSYRGAVPGTWSTTNAEFVAIKDIQIDDRLKITQVAQQNVDITSLLLTCPVCNFSKQCCNQALLKGTTLKSIVCPQPQCRSTRSASKWKFACDRPWYLCDTHGPIGHLAGTAKAQSVKVVAGTADGAAQVKLPRQPNSEKPSSSNHRCHQPPFAPELVTPVEPGPKRQKVGGSNGTEPKRQGKRRSSMQGPLPKIRKQRDEEAIASITRMRDSRTQVDTLRFG